MARNYKMIGLFASALALACLVAAPALADCRQLFVKQHHGYVAQQLVAPVVYYQAGRDIEAEAVAEKVARLAAQKLMQQLANLPPAAGQSQATATLGQQKLTQPQAGAFQKCVQCHSGANPKAGLTLDGQTPVPCQTLWRWLEISMHGKDVPRAMDGLIKQMTPDEKGQLTDAMIKMGSLESQAATVQPEGGVER